MAQLIEVTVITVHQDVWVKNKEGRQVLKRTIGTRILNVGDIEELYDLSDDNKEEYPEANAVIYLRKTETLLRGFVDERNPQYHSFYIQKLYVKETSDKVLKLANA